MNMHLVLRTCNPDMSSHGGFTWPESGLVGCPDWDPSPRCGNGLHGLLWGCGDGDLLNWDREAKWLVVAIQEYVELGGKVKFPRGEVVFCGDRAGATDYLLANGGSSRSIVGATATAGDRGTATAGDRGTAIAGDRGTAIAGDRGTATAGYRGTATAGYQGTAIAGACGTATAGDGGIITIKYWGGDRFRLITGYVGEGIKANTPYVCRGGKLVEKV